MTQYPRTRYLEDAPKGKQWYALEEDFLAHTILLALKIPAGYISNGCSVPRFAWALFPPRDEYFLAGMVHDYLYETRLVDRATADVIFLILLNYYAPYTPIRNYIRYLYVRVLGVWTYGKVKYIDIENYKEV